MPLEYKVTMKPQAREQLRAIAKAEMIATFEEDIIPDAKRLSPVTPEGLSRNIEKHRKRPGGTGTNRRSIDAEYSDTAKGPKAELFTQSGYGGYLEVGTGRMAAQPYLYPAFIKGIKSLGARIKKAIGKRK